MPAVQDIFTKKMLLLGKRGRAVAGCRRGYDYNWLAGAGASEGKREMEGEEWGRQNG